MKYLGIDLGLKRIGFAISDGMLASPLKVIRVRGAQDALEQVLKVIKDEDAEVVVVGKPEGKMGQISGKFIQNLLQKGIKAESSDETLSSKNAIKTMVKLGLSKKKRMVNDSYAATQILQDYLDNRIIK